MRKIMQQTIVILSSILLILSLTGCAAPQKTSDFADEATENTSAPEQQKLYKDKIEEYRKALTMGRDAFDAKYDYGNDCSSINALMVRNTYSYGGAIGYAFFDIDENGVPELIFSDTQSIVDIYTAHDGALIKLFADCGFGYRSFVHILTNGRILTEGSDSAASGSCKMYRFDCSADEHFLPTAAYYFDESGPSSYMTGYTFVDFDKYVDILSNWLSESLFDTLQWKMITGGSDSTDEGPAPTETTAGTVTNGALFNKLDFSSAWSSEYDYEGDSYTLYFAFEENGECYFALAWGYEIISTGIGTYVTIGENILDLELTISGETEEYIYSFDADDNSLTVVSEQGIVGEQGERHLLTENTDNDASKVKDWAMTVDDGLGGWE